MSRRTAEFAKGRRTAEIEGRRTAEIAKSAVLLFASMLFAVLVSEVALRATGYRPTLADPAMYVAHDDPYLPYRMRPNYEGYYMGRRVRLDDDGYRIVPAAPDASAAPTALAASSISAAPALPAVPSVSATLPALAPAAPAAARARRTVLLLGDSVVFGHGLEGSETPAAQLQRLFAARGESVRVRNAAVSGYTTWNELRALEEYVAKHDVDLVVLVYLENDITFDHNQLRLTDGEFGNIGTSPLHRATQTLYRTVYLSYLVKSAAERLQRIAAGGPEASAASEQGSAGDETTPATRSPLDRPAFAHSLEGLRRMQALCDREGIDLRVGIYRDVTYYDEPGRTHAYESQLGDVLAENGIASFVIGSHVKQLSREAVRIAWNDPHPTAEAVGVMARDIYDATARR